LDQQLAGVGENMSDSIGKEELEIVDVDSGEQQLCGFDS
jgi:hypothetical protein